MLSRPRGEGRRVQIAFTAIVSKNKNRRAKYRVAVLTRTKRWQSSAAYRTLCHSWNLSDRGSRFQIRTAAQRKHRSAKRMDLRWTTSVEMSKDLSWRRRVVETSWQSPARYGGKSPWCALYRADQKTDCFWDQITLQWLMTERRVIRQQFQNVV